MSEDQRKELSMVYDSLQTDYKTLKAEYESETDTLSGQLNSLYTQMQNMHREMDLSHRQMMSRSMGRHMQDDKMMSHGMGMHMQNHMAGEWYNQMTGMHEEMANIHEQLGQQSLADMNRKISRDYNNMMKMIPGLDEPSEVPYNNKANPELLNGERLYIQNCASCHGDDAKGITGVFPPLKNSKWLTGNKSTPIRILLHGLTGPIEVNGQAYNGNMPAFKARLSAAEMAAILNYLRSESEEDLPKITQKDVITTGKANSERTNPWQGEELISN